MAAASASPWMGGAIRSHPLTSAGEAEVAGRLVDTELLVDTGVAGSPPPPCVAQRGPATPAIPRISRPPVGTGRAAASARHAAPWSASPPKHLLAEQ